MTRLNYHHLYYFWQVARGGKLTQVAQTLHISQSALSSQIRQLENQLNTQLFERTGRRLLLTSAGKRVMAYANDIFQRGEELEAWARRGIEPEFRQLQIGVRSTMSRNFVDTFVAPLFREPDIRFTLVSGELDHLLERLAQHELDLVLSDTHVSAGTRDHRAWQSQLLARQPLSIIGPEPGSRPLSFPESMHDRRWILPGPDTEIRAAFEGFCAMHQFRPEVLAEADDMAMLRLLTRDSHCLAVLPEVVVRDEIRNGSLHEWMKIPNVYEYFYCVTLSSGIEPGLVHTLRQAFDHPDTPES